MSYVASKTLPFSVELYRQLKRKRTAFAYGFVLSLPILVAIAVKFGPSGNSGGPTRLGSGTADLIGLATIGAANFTVTMLYFATPFLLVTVIALFKFAPTLLVFFAMRTALGLHYSWQMLWAIPVILIALLMGLGMAILISCINVYFRDIASLLPYMTRSLLYLSPILYHASDVSEKIKALEVVNPLFYLLDAWSQVMVYAKAPDMYSLAHSFIWALSIFLIGAYFFLSRERDFAVRL